MGKKYEVRKAESNELLGEAWGPGPLWALQRFPPLAGDPGEIEEVDGQADHFRLRGEIYKLVEIEIEEPET